MSNITNVFSANADSRTLAPAAVGSQVLLMIAVSVRPSMPLAISPLHYTSVE
jgi:hypothetical protein